MRDQQQYPKPSKIENDNKNINKSLPFAPGFPGAAALKPEAPIMRSVTIGHANDLSPSLRLPAQPGLRLQRAETVNVGSYYNKKADRFSYEQPTISAYQPKPVVVKGVNWKVPKDSLKCVPDYFVLEKTSRFIASSDASEVAARISECLCARSIEVTYHEKKVKATCRNADFVKFCVRLFSGRDEYSHGIIVEVQRRSGSNLSFMKDCRAILDAAEGDLSKDSHAMELTPVTEMACLKNVVIERRDDGMIKTALDLILKEKLDSNILGMEYLVFLTDSVKSTNESIAKCVEKLFSSENKEIFDKIIRFVNTLSYEDEDDISSEADFMNKLRNHAMTVLHHLLHSKHSGRVVERVLNLEDDLVSIFVNDLRNAAKRPHDASTAAKCLSAIFRSTANVKVTAHKDDCVLALHEAKNFGSQFHPILARHSDICLKNIECC